MRKYFYIHALSVIGSLLLRLILSSQKYGYIFENYSEDNLYTCIFTKTTQSIARQSSDNMLYIKSVHKTFNSLLYSKKIFIWNRLSWIQLGVTVFISFFFFFLDLVMQLSLNNTAINCAFVATKYWLMHHQIYSVVTRKNLT